MATLRTLALLITIMLIPLMSGCSNDSHKKNTEAGLNENAPAGNPEDTSSSVNLDPLEGEMETHSPIARATPDEEAMKKFRSEYFSGGEGQKRKAFEKYVPIVGAEAVLDFLEENYPMCHAQAHELGRVIFEQSKDIASALKICGKRCTGACMHGVLKAAFGGKDHALIASQVVDFCTKGSIASMHKPGNCVHGIGHAFMLTLGRSLDKSLAACTSIGDPALSYYCATGVFMEYFTGGGGGSSTNNDRESHSPHYPCDQYPKYAAACYRYKVIRMMRELNIDYNQMAKECMSLDRPLRLGCFHGLGTAYVEKIYKRPKLIKGVCRHGNGDDQAMCIEGAIEKLSDYSEPRALAVCEYLEGKNKDICTSAAREKMYRLTKPTISLYTGTGN